MRVTVSCTNLNATFILRVELHAPMAKWKNALPPKLFIEQSVAFSLPSSW